MQPLFQQNPSVSSTPPLHLHRLYLRCHSSCQVQPNSCCLLRCEETAPDFVKPQMCRQSGTGPLISTGYTYSIHNCFLTLKTQPASCFMSWELALLPTTLIMQHPYCSHTKKRSADKQPTPNTLSFHMDPPATQFKTYPPSPSPFPTVTTKEGIVNR